MALDNSILEQLHTKDFVVSKVKGVSMWPLLNQKNTQVYIKKINRPLKKYDVVLFSRGKDLILHRILNVKKAYYLISGDNQFRKEKVNLNQIEGIMTEYYKNGHTKDLSGFKYKLYLIGMLTTRPLRFIRDGIKSVLRMILRRK